MKYVIHSASERGFWHNKQGWVYTASAATKFPSKEFVLPMSSNMDAEWIVISYEEE